MLRWSVVNSATFQEEEPCSEPRAASGYGGIQICHPSLKARGNRSSSNDPGPYRPCQSSICALLRGVYEGFTGNPTDALNEPPRKSIDARPATGTASFYFPIATSISIFLRISSISFPSSSDFERMREIKGATSTTWKRCISTSGERTRPSSRARRIS